GIFDPIQSTAALALDHAEEITAELRKTFSERHRVLTKGLTELGWDVAPSNGGMFIWAKYPYKMDSVTFAFKAIEQTGVIMVPGTEFGTEGEGYVRVALVQPVDLLKKAIDKLKSLTV
ncbi:aminotransferase class I/II-fold pyridoxal phosphate-dependent enzyme, partial [Butyricicoccus sp. 1XD8-22]